MSSNIESVVKQMIDEYHLESLSDSVGKPKLKDIKRRLDNGSITKERAVDEFLMLRDSYRSKRNDRNFKEKMSELIH